MNQVNKDKYVLIINLRRLGKENIETFIAAQNVGLKVVLFAPSLSSQYEQYVDAFYSVDTSSEEAIFSLAESVFKEINVAGILPSSESNVAVVSKLANKFNLPAMPEAAIPNARYKDSMREVGKNNPAVALKNEVIKGVSNLKEACAKVGYPLIIKPTSGFGSIGIFTAKSDTEVDVFLQNYKNISFANSGQPDDIEFIVEEYIDGQEVWLDGVISNGKVTVYGVGDKWTTDKHHLEYFEIFPSAYSPEIQQAIKSAAISVIEDFGFDNCTFHMEGKYGKKGFKLIEVGARPGGDHIISHMIRMVTGINGYEEAIKVCIGEPVSPSITYSGYGSIRYLLAEQEGTLKGYQNLEAAINTPEIEYVIPEVEIGSAIRMPPQCFRSKKLMSFIGRSTDYDYLKSKMEQTVSTVTPVIE